MIAVDANILVYAHRTDGEFHAAADRAVAGLAEGSANWAIPWPCIHEFLAIVTHPRIYDPPTPLPDALEQVACWLESPTLVVLGETADYFAKLRELLLESKVVGGAVHDARVAAICISHGVAELWTADRDFSRFPQIKKCNPLA